MQPRRRATWVAAVLAAGAVAAPTALADEPPIAFSPIGTYTTGLAAPGSTAAEIAAFDDDRMFVVNSTGNSLDVVDTSDPSAPSRIARIDLSPYGAGPNSVDVSRGLVAVAMEAAPKTAPGRVVFFRADGTFVGLVRVGALPDMLTFTGDGRHVVVANEGEPGSYGQPDSVDPEGTVSIIDTAPFRIRHLPMRWWLEHGELPGVVRTVSFRDFNAGARRARDLPAGVRLNGPGASVAQDLEPEYLAIEDDRTAFVTLQENNAVAEIDLRLARVRAIRPLGGKDHSVDGQGLDASDRELPGNTGQVNIRTWPVRGLFMPDAIASFRARGRTYLLTANEGDGRDWPGFSDEARVGALALDPTAFPDAAELKKNPNLGRLTVSRTDGDTDGDGDLDAIHAFGARSLSVWTDDGRRVWDSGDQIERTVAAAQQGFFNSDHSANEFDTRSDNKGPEPEGAAVGRIDGRTYAFVGLERQGGFVVYDVTRPEAPEFVQWANNRDYTRSPVGIDSGPEGLQFIEARRSPTRRPLVLVSNEVTGTVTLYEARPAGGAGVLTLLHNNDGESSLLPIGYTTPSGLLQIGGASAYKEVSDRNVAEARARGNSVLNVYAGDAFLASSTLALSLPPNPATTPVYDAVAQRQMPYDAHVLGNHEFDFAPPFLRRFIDGFTTSGRLGQPFLSANLDFSGQAGFADLIDGDGLIVGSVDDGRVLARSLLHVDPTTGRRVGVVSATTPLLPTISSPEDVTVTPDIPSTAAAVQAQVDRLRSAYGVRTVILVSHLQAVGNDRELVQLMRGVDIAVAGGGDELLANGPSELLPGETQAIAGAYPLSETAADGRVVPIVTTAGNYKYLGRLDVRLDPNGRIAQVLTGADGASGPKRVVADQNGQATAGIIAALGVTDAVRRDATIVESVDKPVGAGLAALNTPIVRSQVVFDTSRAGNRTRETNAGNSIADGFVDSYDRYAGAAGLPPRGPGNPVVGVQNGGGIRQNAGNAVPPSAPGTISRKNTLDVLAFLTNSMTAVRGVGPAQLKDIFERSVSGLPGEGGQFLQVSGLRVVVSVGGTAQQILTDGTVTVPGTRVQSITLADGTPLVSGGAPVPGAPDVTLVTNSFTAGGGDNYPWLRDIPAAQKANLPATYEQAWVEYLTGFPAVGGLPEVPADPRYVTEAGEATPDGRITILP